MAITRPRVTNSMSQFILLILGSISFTLRRIYEIQGRIISREGLQTLSQTGVSFFPQRAIFPKRGGFFSQPLPLARIYSVALMPNSRLKHFLK
jgi:hypothetical protein